MSTAQKVASAIRFATDTLDAHVTARRRVSLSDPVADGVAFAVAQVRQALVAAIEDAALLPIAEYAALHHVQPATVRKWIRTGQLQAEKGGDGAWRVARGAVREHPQRPKLRKAS